MIKSLIIIPYFGKLPNYFQLFLNSCSYNKKFDFLLITDDKTVYDYPNNFKILYRDFSYFQYLVYNHISYECKINSSFKICDYRPAFGFLFKDYVSEYDYWGHCDIDIIFGNLDKMVYPIISKKYYDKIFNLGHLTFYKNDKNINELFFEEILKNKENSIFFTDMNMKFDEENHINSINSYFLLNNYKLYKDQLEADIYTKGFNLYIDYYNFLNNIHTVIKNENIFYFYNGNIYSKVKYNGEIYDKEYCYIHLQKRKMKVDVSFNEVKYIITANKFVKYDLRIDKLKYEDFEKIKTYYFDFNYFNLRLKNLKNKIKNYLRGINGKI